jgi:hypothetical protein
MVFALFDFRRPIGLAFKTPAADDLLAPRNGCAEDWAERPAPGQSRKLLAIRARRRAASLEPKASWDMEACSRGREKAPDWIERPYSRASNPKQ